MRRLILLLFLMTCFVCENYAQSNFTKSFVHGGITREYKIYVPASYSGQAVPFILNLHGYGSDMTQQEAYGNFRPIADTANFIVVHPNGTFDGSFKRYWNFLGMSTIDDVGFLSALIDTVKASYNIDLNRVYSTGMSNGGIMSYYLACNLSGRIAAIASVTGTMTPAMKDNCNASHPTPAMEVHGTADPVVPYNGNSTFIPIDSVVDFWRSFNNCNTNPVVTSIANTNTSDGCTATRYDYLNGTSGSKVVFYKITDGGHTWPGAPIDVGVTNHDYDASSEIWRFFRPYQKNMLTSVTEKKSAERLIVYPNPACDKITLNIEDEVDLKVMDINSKLIFTKHVAPSESVDVSELNKGVYFLTVNTSKQRRTVFFIKN
jgi:polyhydroxybutyrate depolymerase